MALKFDFKSLLLNIGRPSLSMSARLVGLLAGERDKSQRNSSNADFNITPASRLSTDNPCDTNCLVLATMTQFNASLLSTTEARLYMPVSSELLAEGASRRRRAR
jgi:hypothetical protein